MKRVFGISSFVVLLLMTICTIPALAQNESVTYVHVDRAVAIPGGVLNSGDYVFRLMPSAQFPSSVEIISKNGHKFYGYVPVYPALRSSNYLGNEINVSKTQEAGLARVDSFYLPGMTNGFRFVYSSSDLRKIEMASTKSSQTRRAGL